MCVMNEEEDYKGENSDYRCGMCEECCSEAKKKRDKQKEKDTSCGNCGWCEECCD